MAEDGGYRLLVRPVMPEDLETVAAIFTASRGELAFLPQLHSPEEDRAFVAGLLDGTRSFFVALFEGALSGFIVVGGGFIEHLYVAPPRCRRGIGSALLLTAMAEARELKLWTFQKNERARLFYERHGFSALLFTDGSENEEHEPDVLYHWVSPAAA